MSKFSPEIIEYKANTLKTENLHNKIFFIINWNKNCEDDGLLVLLRMIFLNN